MKMLASLVLMVLVFASCSKNADVKPVITSSNAKTIAVADTTSSNKTPQLTHDDSLHVVFFKARPQQVITNVSGTKLTMILNENVDLLFSAEGYQKTSAIHLSENFKNTLLNGFEFTTVAEAGNVTLNWVDDNLNNVILKSVTDTVINKQPMVKVNVHRAFTFFKVYDTAAQAINEQNIFLQNTGDVIGFSSYTYYNLVNYAPYSSSAALAYTK